jgi:hypothetical protein
VAFYFGCDLALYVSFVINMTSYLLILGLIGVGIQVLGFFLNADWEMILETIYVFFVMVWLILMNV